MVEPQGHPNLLVLNLGFFVFAEKHLCCGSNRGNGDNPCSGPGLDQ